jgi:hypothetical protein
MECFFNLPASPASLTELHLDYLNDSTDSFSGTGNNVNNVKVVVSTMGQ